MPERVTLVIGGARSGKSAYAERLVVAEPGQPVYVATGVAIDDEMRERIEHHKARRGGNWTTIEAPVDLGAALRQAPPSAAVLVDCLTLWLTNLLLGERDVERAIAAFEAGLDAREAATVIVANEVGLGIVPDTPLGRGFRDEAGRLNQRMAARADRVVLMVAGLPLTLKEPT